MKKITTLLIMSILLTACGATENKMETNKINKVNTIKEKTSIEKPLVDDTLSEEEIDDAINEIFADLEK